MKRPRCYHKVILFACALPCLSAQASDVPDDFLELFDYKDRMVSLRDLNGQDKVSIRLEVNYDSVRLPAHSEESKAVLAGVTISPAAETAILVWTQSMRQS